MNNNTFKNAFDANLGTNFNIETTNNIGKIINTHYNIYRKIYPKNLDSTRNKFKKNNEKRQTILKNSSSVNVLLTFFPYNNTNNNWFCAENMFSFMHIKQGFWKIFRKIFEEINKFVNKTPDMFIRKFNYITEKFTNNNSKKILSNNFIIKKFQNSRRKIVSKINKKTQKNNFKFLKNGILLNFDVESPIYIRIYVL